MTDEESQRKEIKSRRLAWTVVIVIFLASAILSMVTIGNYTEIAKAKILTSVATEETVSIGIGNGGELESVNLTLRFTIDNPSQKAIKPWILTYKGWVRDMPLEDGVDTERWRIDGSVSVNGSEREYYPVFVASYNFDSPQIIIEGLSNVTITKYLEINGTNYPDIFKNLAEIYNYTNGQELEWMHYSYSLVFIVDVPPNSGPNHDANLIRRYEGFDITPGVGGVGP